MKEYSNCPNCGAKIKNNVFTASNLILSQAKIDLINEYEPVKAEAYCDECGNSIIYKKIQPSLTDEIDKLKALSSELIDSIPVISLQSPVGWDYEVVGMVTGQSTTGTGVLSEMFSSMTDLFGAQSGSYNNKLKVGENLCFTQLRKQAIDLGAHAVLGTDIDYSEVGGDKGMLMVCMAGTAIRLKNPSILGEKKAEEINTLDQSLKKIVTLTKALRDTRVA